MVYIPKYGLVLPRLLLALEGTSAFLPPILVNDDKGGVKGMLAYAY